MHPPVKHRFLPLVLAVSVLAFVSAPRADVVSDWNTVACELVVEARQGPPAACRSLAMVHTAVYEAVNAVTKRYPGAAASVVAAPGASVDAAVAAACRSMLATLLPARQAEIEKAYMDAMAKVPEGEAKSAGVAVGESAARAVLAARAEDRIDTRENYRPRTAAAVYVPTATPVFSTWPARKPWLMKSAAEFRPGPPPDLKGERWARDYNEIKAVGEKSSATRTPEQTEIARFWEATMPPIYHGLIHSVASMPGREITQNARLYAAATQAMDDALIAIFDAKYYYGFWRPLTAIRNGDIDGNSATERDETWTPFIDTPMHPEYPCAHCVVSGSLGVVLEAEIGDGPTPVLTTTSPTADGASRSWNSVDEFVREVANARIYDGVHFRTSTEVGTEMGRRVGALAVERWMRPAR